MLSRLTISNYALIDNLDFTPGEGLSIITGETGAGKSVMLGALSLIRGERAELRVIADKERKAVVEASFSRLDPAMAESIKDIDPEWDGEELIIRREIYPSGRSRAFVNDSPATLTRLEELTRGLLDIHSQNNNSLLAEERVQLGLLDAVAAHRDLLATYGAEFRRYVALRQEIRRLKEEAGKNKEREEMIVFRLGQLDKLKPRAGELKKIETRHETLSNSEEVRESLVNAARALGGDEGAGAMDLIEKALSAIEGLDFSLWQEPDPQVAERLRQCVVEIKDILETLEDVAGALEYNPAVLASLSGRMREYYNAMKAFKVDSDAELEELHNTLRRQYQSLESGESGTEELEKEAKETAGRLKQLAAEITAGRSRAAQQLQGSIEKEAKKLGLDNLTFEIRLGEAKLSKTGGDKVAFLASFNKNSVMAPVGDMASGGEMARLMLAIKKITSGLMSLPTIIFDEIDTGVSGHIADRMGEMMKAMGEEMQILTITHLPQVASKGERHFKVYKQDIDDKTVSDVKLLNETEREEEIGRMLAGEKLDSAALTNARSLLGKDK